MNKKRKEQTILWDLLNNFQNSHLNRLTDIINQKESEVNTQIKNLLKNRVQITPETYSHRFKKTLEGQQLLSRGELTRQKKKINRDNLHQIKRLDKRLKRNEALINSLETIRQVARIKTQPQPTSSFSIQGRMVNGRNLGIKTIAGEPIYISLRDKDKKLPIKEMSKIRIEPDDSGYFQILLYEKDIERLEKKKKSDLVLVALYKNGKVIKEVNGVVLPTISRENLNTNIIRNLVHKLPKEDRENDKEIKEEKPLEKERGQGRKQPIKPGDEKTGNKKKGSKPVSKPRKKDTPIEGKTKKKSSDLGKKKIRTDPKTKLRGGKKINRINK